MVIPGIHLPLTAWVHGAGHTFRGDLASKKVFHPAQTTLREADLIRFCIR